MKSSLHERSWGGVESLVLIGLVAASASCNSNASNPTASVERDHLYQSETRMAFVPATSKILLAYNDQSGVYQWGGPTNDTLVPIEPHYETLKGKKIYIGQTFAGLSVSNDFGASWTNVGPIQPVAPAACAQPLCPEMLRGDPWIATNGTRVLYTDIAFTTPVDVTTPSGAVASPPALAVARSENGTEHFGTPYVAAYIPFSFVDTPAVSMVGDTAVAAFDDDSSAIYVVTTDNSGVDARWQPDPPVALPVPPTSFAGYKHEVIRLVTPQLAYLGYVEYGVSGNALSYAADVARLTRGGTIGALWSPTVVFHFDGVDLNVPATATGELGRNWDDLIPMSFDVGADNELHVVFRFNNATAGVSNDLVYWHCVDGNAGACSYDYNTNTLTGWAQTTFSTNPSIEDPFTGGKFQPSVAADPNQSAAGIFWYQQAAPNSEFYAPFGVTVLGGVPSGGELPYPNPEYGACPSSGVDPLTGGHYYGDYTGTLFVFDLVNPFNPTMTPEPEFITAYARSNTCTNEDSVTHDQFVQAAGW